MKYISLSIIAALFLFACQPTEQKQEEESTPVAKMSYHGEKITTEDAVALADFQGEEGNGIKLSGEVEKVCQAKGCWMTMKMADGKTMRVTFKDYGFFVPKDISGKTAIVQGDLKVDTTSVEDLRHYAEDEGMDPEEAAKKYTEPELSMSFVASGVIIK